MRNICSKIRRQRRLTFCAPPRLDEIGILFVDLRFVTADIIEPPSLHFPLLNPGRPVRLHCHFESKHPCPHRLESNLVVTILLNTISLPILDRLPLIAIPAEHAPRTRHTAFTVSGVVKPIDLDFSNRLRFLKGVFNPFCECPSLATSESRCSRRRQRTWVRPGRLSRARCGLPKR